MDKDKEFSAENDRPCLSRRRFIQRSSGATVTSILLTSCVPEPEGKPSGSTETAEQPTETVEAQLAGYPRKKVGKLSELKPDEPVSIRYPHEDLSSLCFMVKLGVPAGGGVGPDSDIVAFNSLCTHMGGDLSDTAKTYLKDHKLLGPCPLHLTTFDIRRHGMVCAGHATESLPQIVLEVDGDDIYATGVLGLIYGKRDSADVSEV